MPLLSHSKFESFIFPVYNYTINVERKKKFDHTFRVGSGGSDDSEMWCDTASCMYDRERNWPHPLREDPTHIQAGVFIYILYLYIHGLCSWIYPTEHCPYQPRSAFRDMPNMLLGSSHAHMNHPIPRLQPHLLESISLS